MRKCVATAILGTALVGLGLPVPSSHAEPSLGGYEAFAQATSVRVMVFDPVIPIPAEPQGDVGIGYTRSNTTTGPSSRALASYLWPGGALGDGLGVLAGNEALDYPVKVNSKFPANPDAPENNTAQVTDGNGMTTSADGVTTTSTVSGLGVTGANLASGTGTGLCGLFSEDCPDAPEEPAPVEVPEPLAAAVTMDSVFSQSEVTLKDHGIATTAHTRVSGLSLLGGVVTIDSLDIKVLAGSDGNKTTTSGVAMISGLEIAGQKVKLADKVELGGTSNKVPDIPVDQLAAMGIGVEYLATTKGDEKGVGAIGTQALTFTLDVAKLRDAAGLGGATDPLLPSLDQIPQIGPLLSGLAKLGSKIVIAVGDVSVSAKATPAYVAPPIDDATDDGTDNGDDQSGGNSSGTGSGGGSGSGSYDSGSAPDSGPAVPVSPDAGDSTTTQTTPVADSLLPGLGQVPPLLLLSALALAGAIGWAFRVFGSLFIGSPNCLMGLKSGCPDLRKG